MTMVGSLRDANEVRMLDSEGIDDAEVGKWVRQCRREDRKVRMAV